MFSLLLRDYCICLFIFGVRLIKGSFDSWVMFLLSITIISLKWSWSSIANFVNFARNVVHWSSHGLLSFSGVFFLYWRVDFFYIFELLSDFLQVHLIVDLIHFARYDVFSSIYFLAFDGDYSKKIQSFYLDLCFQIFHQRTNHFQHLLKTIMNILFLIKFMQNV